MQDCWRRHCFKNLYQNLYQNPIVEGTRGTLYITWQPILVPNVCRCLGNLSVYQVFHLVWFVVTQIVMCKECKHSLKVTYYNLS